MRIWNVLPATHRRQQQKQLIKLVEVFERTKANIFITSWSKAKWTNFAACILLNFCYFVSGLHDIKLSWIFNVEAIHLKFIEWKFHCEWSAIWVSSLERKDVFKVL